MSPAAWALVALGLVGVVAAGAWWSRRKTYRRDLAVVEGQRALEAERLAAREKAEARYTDLEDMAPADALRALAERNRVHARRDN